MAGGNGLHRQRKYKVKYDESQVLEKDLVPVYERDGWFVKGHVDDMIECSKCNEIKNQREYSLHSEMDQYGRRILKTYCNPCHRKMASTIYYLKKKHKRATNCQICNKITSKMNLDHDHETGKFRGWLCPNCNSGIGRFGDNVENLEKAIKYLKGETYD
jgi:hypothetical protein